MMYMVYKEYLADSQLAYRIALSTLQLNDNMMYKLCLVVLRLSEY